MQKEQRFLNSGNVEAMSDCEITPYPLPGFPGYSVFVQQQPIGVMKRISKQLERGGELAEAAQVDLIQRSVVNPDGSPVYTSDKVALLKTGKTKLFAALVKVIGKANTPQSEDETSTEIEALGNG